jgi:DNA excision repair protein ERCC-3
LTQNQPLEAAIVLERAKSLVDQLVGVIPQLNELKNLSEEAKKRIEEQITSYTLSLRTTKLKPEELTHFFKKPYTLLPAPHRQDSWHLIIPRFIDAQFGWLEKQDVGYNVFLVNRYVEWLGGLPEEIKKQLGWKTPLQLELRGETLIGSPEALREAWSKYRPFLRHQEEKGIRINPHRAFELIASLVKDGILPFTPQHVPPDQLRPPVIDFQPRPYQEEAWQKFLQYGNIGVFYPASVGKTFLGLYVMASLKGPHIVVVPTRILQEQWIERIQAHTSLKPEEYVVTTYQSALKRYAGRQWSTLIVDEAHHLPANEFAKLSLIKRKYTLGLTASPQREDGREEYIFALTGYPVGLGWQHFRDLGVIASPVLNVWIIKNFEAKLSLLKNLVARDKKTIIFADSIEIGKTIAARFNAPHVHGATREDRLKTIIDAKVSVVSRVGDEGVSLPDVEMVIEVDWLYGSRRQELQRFTRTLHSRTANPEYHILMTLEEYLHDRKRLFSVMDKGFKVEIHREGISEDTIAEKLAAQSAFLQPRSRKLSRRVDSRSSGETPMSALVRSNLEGVLELPGVKKVMGGLTGPQRRLYQLLLQNDGTWFKKSKLPLVLGYTSEHSMDVTIKIGQLVKRALIERSHVDGETAYRTNVSTRVS